MPFRLTTLQKGSRLWRNMPCQTQYKRELALVCFILQTSLGKFGKNIQGVKLFHLCSLSICETCFCIQWQVWAWCKEHLDLQNVRGGPSWYSRGQCWQDWSWWMKSMLIDTKITKLEHSLLYFLSNPDLIY